LLTELILDGRYPPYNSRLRPSPRGAAFLGALHELSFGEDTVSLRDPVFVDEIDFPARHPDEKGCAPDYTVFVDDRCWIIELKTEPGSHRARQIPDYFERAHHYHPELRVDITYLTAGLRVPFQPQTQPWERYVHIEWAQTTDLILSIWSDVTDERVREIATMLLTGITHLHEPAGEWWPRLGYRLEPAAVVEAAEALPSGGSLLAKHTTSLASAALGNGLDLAMSTAQDGRQRAVGLEAGGLEALDELRLGLRRACRAEPPESPLRKVQPWLWSVASSRGRALTTAGAQTGYEVRLSRNRSAT
jgi:hypothetical protein